MTIMPAWIAPPDLDPECLELCAALNGLNGIRTVESCCGHGKNPYRIWFLAVSLEALPAVAYAAAGCHCGHYGWRVIAKTDCGMSPIMFTLEGPMGPESHAESLDIAREIREIGEP